MAKEGYVEGYFESKKMLGFNGQVNGVKFEKGTSGNVEVLSVIISQMKQDGFVFYPRKQESITIPEPVKAITPPIIKTEPVKPVPAKQPELKNVEVIKVPEPVKEKQPEPVNKVDKKEADSIIETIVFPESAIKSAVLKEKQIKPVKEHEPIKNSVKTKQAETKKTKTGTYKGDTVEIVKETSDRLIITHNGVRKTVGKNVVIRN